MKPALLSCWLMQINHERGAYFLRVLISHLAQVNGTSTLSCEITSSVYGQSFRLRGYGSFRPSVSPTDILSAGFFSHKRQMSRQPASCDVTHSDKSLWNSSRLRCRFQLAILGDFALRPCSCRR